LSWIIAFSFSEYHLNVKIADDKLRHLISRSIAHNNNPRITEPTISKKTNKFKLIKIY
jgi:hypothetical protein